MSNEKCGNCGEEIVVRETDVMWHFECEQMACPVASVNICKSLCSTEAEATVVFKLLSIKEILVMNNVEQTKLLKGFETLNKATEVMSQNIEQQKILTEQIVDVLGSLVKFLRNENKSEEKEKET